MRKRRGKTNWGCFVVIGGIVIILALILPAGFWWFLLALALIVAGIGLMCRY